VSSKYRAGPGFQLASEDYRDVLNAGIDICVVASPSSFHYEHAKAALEAGAHVLCEKPVTIDPNQAWDLDEIARAAKRTLTIAFGWNYTPLVVGAKNLMEDHGIGSLEQFSINMSSATRELLSSSGSYPDADKETLPENGTWTDKSLSGGGYGQAQLSHALGLAFWLLNARADSAFAMMSNPGGTPVELHDAITYRLENGAIGTVSGGSAHTEAARKIHALQLRAIGDDGQLLIDLERAAVWFYHKGKNYNLECRDEAGAYDCCGPIDVLVAAGRGAPILNCSNGNLGARTVEALDLAYRSAESGQLVTR
jgi:predicted dehydrogenase